ncbi:MAG: nitroreductase family protein [Rhodospirillales bacterium]
MIDAPARLHAALSQRFADAPEAAAANEALARMAGHRSHRAFLDKPVDAALIKLLCAVALSAPSKSDLQQRDIVIVADKTLRQKLDALMADMDWLPAAPALLVVCANNRRQRLVHEWRNKPFANDHLDAFFNAATDAAIVLGWLVLAAEAAGLGCCPLSVIRNRAEEASALLDLPQHVFPYAGLALGWPRGEGQVVPRLPLAATVHTDRFDDARIREQVADYDKRRRYRSQRYEAEYGRADPYGWSEDKARQYSKPERAGFGAFVRGKGFKLD